MCVCVCVPCACSCVGECLFAKPDDQRKEWKGEDSPDCLPTLPLAFPTVFIPETHNETCPPSVP